MKIICLRLRATRVPRRDVRCPLRLTSINTSEHRIRISMVRSTRPVTDGNACSLRRHHDASLMRSRRAPASPVVTQHRRSGSPWVPVRPYYEVLPLMADAGSDEGSRRALIIVVSLRSGPGRRSRVEDSNRWRAGGGVLARHEAPSTRCQTKTSAQSASAPSRREGQWGGGQRKAAPAPHRNRGDDHRYVCLEI